MKIWEFGAVAERYDSLIPVDGYTYEELISFDGRSHKNDWACKKVVPNINPKKNPKFGDYSECMGVLVFSQKAIEKLYDFIKDDVEILPLECDYGEFSIIRSALHKQSNTVLQRIIADVVPSPTSLTT